MLTFESSSYAKKHNERKNSNNLCKKLPLKKVKKILF